MELQSKKCIPCEGGAAKLDADKSAQLLEQVPGWNKVEEKILRTFQFKDFIGAMRFINRMAEVAETEGHHPDFTVHYNIVEVTIWTHAIGGLSENDFILAAKLNAIPT